MVPVGTASGAPLQARVGGNDPALVYFHEPAPAETNPTVGGRILRDGTVNDVVAPLGTRAVGTEDPAMPLEQIQQSKDHIEANGLDSPGDLAGSAGWTLTRIVHVGGRTCTCTCG